MSRFTDVRGEPTFGVALCARCSRKFKLAELRPDPNFPALMVCRDDQDEYDPYRLAPRGEDRVTLPFVRPDEPISTSPSGVITEDGDAFLLTEDGNTYLVP